MKYFYSFILILTLSSKLIFPQLGIQPFETEIDKYIIKDFGNGNPKIKLNKIKAVKTKLFTFSANNPVEQKNSFQVTTYDKYGRKIGFNMPFHPLNKYIERSFAYSLNKDEKLIEKIETYQDSVLGFIKKRTSFTYVGGIISEEKNYYSYGKEMESLQSSLTYIKQKDNFFLTNNYISNDKIVSNGDVFEITVNKAGMPTQVATPNSSGKMDVIEEYTYDKNNRLSLVKYIRQRSTQQYTYDKANNQLVETRYESKRNKGVNKYFYKNNLLEYIDNYINDHLSNRFYFEYEFFD